MAGMTLTINDRIRDRKVEFFNQFKLSLRYDSVASSFSFNGYFNPDNPEQKDIYCVGHYHIAKLDYNGQRLLTGYVITEAFNDGDKKELSQFGGYSFPGFLEDCQIPPDLYPLQSDGLTLREIVNRFIPERFNIKVKIDPVVSKLMDEPFEKTTAEATESIKDYIVKLAAQKAIVVSHDVFGNLLFTRANTDQAPVMEFSSVPTKTRTIPFTKMDLAFDGQAMHSDIHVVKQADSEGGNAGESHIKNPFVPYVYRPKVVTQSSGSDVDTDKVAQMSLAAELKGLKFKIVTSQWEIDGKKKEIITPNKIIMVTNPQIYLYNKTRLFVEEVQYAGDSKAMTATLTCCLPEVYSLKTPAYLWKGINTH